MALKDWKKTYDGKIRLKFIGNNNWVEIERNYNDIYDSSTKRVWWFFTQKQKPRKFKTKSQALKFAKSYMRKH